MFEERALAFDCGGERLVAILSQPAKPARRGVLIVVGGPQYRAGSHRQFTLLARSLAQAGIPALRFDYRGMGDSEGEMRGFEDVEADLRAAIDQFFASSPGLREVVLLGLCDGASAAAAYACGDARVAGLALLNPWVRTEQGAARATLKHYYRDRLLSAGLWKKILGGRFDARAAFSSALSLLRRSRSASATPDADLPQRMHGQLRRFGGRLLVVLGSADLTAQEFADLASANPAWRALLNEPRVTWRGIAGADHTFSRREWHEALCAATRDWVRAW